MASEGNDTRLTVAMLAKHVSPPTLGTRTTRSTEPIGGFSA